MKLNRKKMVLLLAAAMLILVCGVGGTLAYLVTQDGPVENTFTPGRVTSIVSEEFEQGGTTKTNVKIQNTGNVSAYIRAAIVVTWQEVQGNTLPETPTVNDDYTIACNTGANSNQWTVGSDGYYYYNDVVPADESTANLINSCTREKTYADGRKLCVEVIGSAIQAEGMGVTSAKAAVEKAATGN